MIWTLLFDIIHRQPVYRRDEDVNRILCVIYFFRTTASELLQTVRRRLIIIGVFQYLQHIPLRPENMTMMET